ncbi:hypothetical protein GCM10009721_37900 [Terrabacter tumescens]|uniref:Uncharacterized protein n=2 Tax=Intrasporangiaceae TaxID=85021 RepID=A0ABQ2IBZ9_9MICO|nr:hypothetical protein GCM10009721_37900 [Terrabacter tumescens]
MWGPTSAAESGGVQKGTSRGKTMIEHYSDLRAVQAEIESRYPQRRRTRRDSSLEVIRRTMARNTREENGQGRRR